MLYIYIHTNIHLYMQNKQTLCFYVVYGRNLRACQLLPRNPLFFVLCFVFLEGLFTLVPF